MKLSLVAIPDSIETTLQNQYLREYSNSRFPNVELIQLDREQTIVDPLYMEATNKRYKNPIPIRCLPDAEVPRRHLPSMG